MTRPLVANRTRDRATEAELVLVDNDDATLVTLLLDDEELVFDRTELAAALVGREAA